MYFSRYTKSLLDTSLTSLSNGSFLKLWLLKGVEVRLTTSDCTCLPSFCLSTPSWTACLSSSCTSGSLSSFFRLALLMELSSENLLTRGRSDGDLSVVESGLWWSSLDEGEERKGLKAGKQTWLCYWDVFCLIACIKYNIKACLKHGGTAFFDKPQLPESEFTTHDTV